MNDLAIINGRVIDPAQQMDRVTNLLIEDGRIVAYDYTNHRKTRLDEDLRGKLAGLERGA